MPDNARARELPQSVRAQVDELFKQFGIASDQLQSSLKAFNKAPAQAVEAVDLSPQIYTSADDLIALRAQRDQLAAQIAVRETKAPTQQQKGTYALVKQDEVSLDEQLAVIQALIKSALDKNKELAKQAADGLHDSVLKICQLAYALSQRHEIAESVASSSVSDDDEHDDDEDELKPLLPNPNDLNNIPLPALLYSLIPFFREYEHTLQTDEARAKFEVLKIYFNGLCETYAAIEYADQNIQKVAADDAERLKQAAQDQADAESLAAKKQWYNKLGTFFALVMAISCGGITTYTTWMKVIAGTIVFPLGTFGLITGLGLIFVAGFVANWWIYRYGVPGLFGDLFVNKEGFSFKKILRGLNPNQRRFMIFGGVFAVAFSVVNTAITIKALVALGLLVTIAGVAWPVTIFLFAVPVFFALTALSFRAIALFIRPETRARIWQIFVNINMRRIEVDANGNKHYESKAFYYFRVIGTYFIMFTGIGLAIVATYFTLKSMLLAFGGLTGVLGLGYAVGFGLAPFARIPFVVEKSLLVFAKLGENLVYGSRALFRGIVFSVAHPIQAAKIIGNTIWDGLVFTWNNPGQALKNFGKFILVILTFGVIVYNGAGNGTLAGLNENDMAMFAVAGVSASVLSIVIGTEGRLQTTVGEQISAIATESNKHLKQARSTEAESESLVNSTIADLPDSRNDSNSKPKPEPNIGTQIVTTYSLEYDSDPERPEVAIPPRPKFKEPTFPLLSPLATIAHLRIKHAQTLPPASVHLPQRRLPRVAALTRHQSFDDNDVTKLVLSRLPLYQVQPPESPQSPTFDLSYREVFSELSSAAIGLTIDAKDLDDADKRQEAPIVHKRVSSTASTVSLDDSGCDWAVSPSSHYYYTSCSMWQNRLRNLQRVPEHVIILNLDDTLPRWVSPAAS